MQGAWFSAVAVALTLCACGPHLNSNLRVERAFAASADCAQGPFEIEVPSLGSKWGEEISLEAYGHPIRGNMQLMEGGMTLDASSFGPEPEFVHNERCRLVVSEVGRAGPVSGAAPGPSSSAQAGVPAATAKTAPVTLRELPNTSTPLGQTRVVDLSFPVDHLNAISFRPGSKLKITFWSAEPNDLRGVVFLLRQHELVPSVPEPEWIAHLERESADEEREHKEREAEADARVAAENAENAKWRAHLAECEKTLERSDCSDAKAARAEEQRRVAQFEHLRFCEAHLSDVACDDVRKRRDEAAARVRFEACKPHPNDPACAEFHEALHSDHPRGPPPAPLAEEQPPKPSVNADWVPGGWTWDGWDFKWTGGGWRVPDSDIRARLTMTAPSAPPPTRVEVAVAQPVAGAIWVPGAWHWNGGSWVWLGGAWRMPPQAGLRWRPPSWLVSSRGVQLDPGRWVR